MHSWAFLLTGDLMQNYWLKPQLVPFMTTATMNYYDFDSIEAASVYDPLTLTNDFAERVEICLGETKIPGDRHELEIIYKQSDPNLLDALEILLMSGNLDIKSPTLRKDVEYGLVKNKKWLLFKFPKISMHFEKGTSIIRVWGFFEKFSYDHSNGWPI